MSLLLVGLGPTGRVVAGRLTLFVTLKPSGLLAECLSVDLSVRGGAAGADRAHLGDLIEGCPTRPESSRGSSQCCPEVTYIQADAGRFATGRSPLRKGNRPQ